MSKPISSVTNRSDVTLKSHRRAYTRTFHNIIAIWLDNDIDGEDNSNDHRKKFAQLHRVCNTFKTFINEENCIEFIHTITNDKSCIIIISSALGPYFVPRIHDISQVDSIFILCSDDPLHEQWINKWYKIKGAFKEVDLICQALEEAAHLYEQNAISISFVDASSDNFSKNVDRLDPSFMYTQILKEIILTIKFEQQHIQEFSNHCCAVFADNDFVLQKIKKFERNYSDERAILWYTSEHFVYSMLNEALRQMDMDVIIKIGFFIRDLHRQITDLLNQNLGNSHSSETFTVYRGQGLSKPDFEKMTNTKGGLLSFNNFLSTSTDYDVSSAFAESNLSNPNLLGILFVMTIHPLKSTASFASIKDVSQFQEEDEVLFSMHTVFRIDDIQCMNENQRLFRVSLTLTDDSDKELRMLTDCIREESFPKSSGWYRLGLMLLKMRQPEKAQQVYEALLRRATYDEKAPIYHHLGLAKKDRGEYKEAITFFEKSISIKKKSPFPNYPSIANSYSSLGSVYFIMGDYSKAIWFYEKAHEIKEKTLPSGHPSLAKSYNNMGVVYRNTGDYPRALSYYTKSLEINKKSLPPNHPDLGSDFDNIGNVYENMEDYSEALSSYKKALEIKQLSLPPIHPDLAASYNNIGIAYTRMGEYTKALLSHEKALAIRQKSLPPSHPDLATSYNNIGVVYHNMNEYSKAFSSYEKALSIHKESLLPNHPVLGGYYNNLGMVSESMGEYSKANAFYKHAIEIAESSLASDHPNLQLWRENFQNIQKKL